MVLHFPAFLVIKLLSIPCPLSQLVALVVGLSGVYLLLNYNQNGLFFSHMYIILPGVLALASAACLLASGGLGCWVSMRESVWVQTVVRYYLCVWMRGWCVFPFVTVA